ncbi:TetR/AcrR family transcriptional regulator [Aciditerrimonas ferrireducens]|uniref:TetR/AcrR family transcriptional regulator n=1 Tax=Aciditerrimonas ferrireducens TaxID=667306 RepID=A0ABV6C2N8_9ACTN
MAEGARETLLAVAERLVATRGIGGTSLRDVQLESGQRNKSVVQYYFGSREGLVRAVVEARMDPINRRRFALLAGLGPEPSLRALVEAFVAPLAEQTVLAPRSFWARFLLQASFDPSFRRLVRESLSAASFRAVWVALAARLGQLPEPARQHRVERMVEFVLVALASAEEARDEGRLAPGEAPDFVADLVAMCCGLLEAPNPPASGEDHDEEERSSGEHPGVGRAALAGGGRPGARGAPGPAHRASPGRGDRRRRAVHEERGQRHHHRHR